jgi:hypothetical protein
VYEQDAWVRLQQWDSAPIEETRTLWVLLNRHLCRVVRALSAADAARTVDTGKAGVEVHDLAFVLDDYVRHLRVHVGQLGL